MNVIFVSRLEKVQILWRGDVRALADFLLRSYDARDRQINARSDNTSRATRPTLHGLAGIFAGLTDMPRSDIETQLQADGFDLGAVVEFDPKPGEGKGA